MDISFFDGKSVLVLGGRGKLLNELTELMLNTECHRLAFMSSEEKSLMALKAHFLNRPGYDRLRFFLGDKRDKERLMRAFDGVDLVLSLDCFSNRRLLDYNPMEAVKNNITAMENLADTAIDRGVSYVFSVNRADFFDQNDIYDAAKVCSEKLLISANGLSAFRKTRFSTMRIGDIWDYPDCQLKMAMETQNLEVLFDYLESAKSIYRFGSSVSEVCSGIVAALRHMTGGEVFIPKLKCYSIKDYIRATWKGAVLKDELFEQEHSVFNFPSEASSMKELQDFFAILPNHAWWDQEIFMKKNPSAKSIKDKFVYTTANAPVEHF